MNPGTVSSGAGGRAEPAEPATSRPLPRLKPRDLVIVLVIAAHVLLVWLLVHRTHVVLESAASAARGGSSIAVQLVSRPAAPAPAPEPAQVSRPRSLPHEAPTHAKAPPVMHTEAPSTREVARRAQPAAAPPSVPALATPAAPPTVLPAAPAAAAPPAPSNDAARPPAPGATRPSLDTKQISSGDMAQLGCRIPAPVYPAKARRLGQAGVVTLRVTVATDGRIARAVVSRSSGYPALDDAAVEALQAGRCQPYLENGMPRQVEASQPIAFHLDD